MTEQAKRLLAAMLTLGLPRRSYSVRTETYRRRDRGARYTEYGHAVLTCYTRTAREAVIANADRLRAAGCTVQLHTFRDSDGQPFTMPTVTA